MTNDPLQILKHLKPEQMRIIRSKIDELLPRAGLDTLNLEEELVSNYQLTVTLYQDLINDDEVPANQKAQVVNSCNAMLKTIADLQESVHGTEKVKRLQQVFVATLKQLPNAEEALTIYERLLRGG